MKSRLILNISVAKGSSEDGQRPTTTFVESFKTLDK